MQFHRPVELKLVRWQWMQSIPLNYVCFCRRSGKPRTAFLLFVIKSLKGGGKAWTAQVEAVILTVWAAEFPQTGSAGPVLLRGFELTAS